MADLLRAERRGGVLLLTIANSPVNALSRSLRAALLAAFVAARDDATLEAVVLTGKGKTFIAGADLAEMDRPAEDPSLPEVVAALAASPVPVVAALNGAALGGGYEIALACDLRLIVEGASVGLPETRLGLIPGAGGTQRLMRLVGLPEAIRLIGGGVVVQGEEAVARNLADRLVPAADLVETALSEAPATPRRPLAALAVPPAAPAEVEAALAEVMRRAKGNSAIAAAAALMRETAALPFADGSRHERACFLARRDGDESKALRYLFLAERAARKSDGALAAPPRPIDRVAVIGAGTMGRGIAGAAAGAGCSVTLLDGDPARTLVAIDSLRADWSRDADRGRISAAEVRHRAARLTAAADWADLGAPDLVIEAVSEDVETKRDVLAQLSARLGPDAIVATNTSYLDIDGLAGGYARPGRFLGLHFFAPAQVMRLVEVVPGALTEPAVTEAARAFATRLGKLPVVAGRCEGFIGNRLFALYRRLVECLVEDGNLPEEVDAALEAFGFALGPFAVFDLSGLDIAWALRKRRANSRPPGERYVDIPDRLCEAGRLGRKTGAGWYRYEAGRPIPDEAVASLIAEERRRKAIAAAARTPETIVRLVLTALANEGQKICDEGIAARASDIDLVLVNGYGFPAMRGGPMFWMSGRRRDEVLADVESLRTIAGAGFEPAHGLVGEAGS